MERLQAAIEKARAQRDKTETGTPRFRKKPAVPPKTGQSDTDRPAWEALEALQIDRKRLLHNRVTTYEHGDESAPFDLLRTRMLQQAHDNGWRRIGLVSPNAGCGKSTVAVNLAFSLARHRDIYSLVLDFDLRRKGMTNVLGQFPSLGTADVLRRQADFSDVARRFGPNLAFGLNSERRVQDPSEILQSAMATEILEELETRYRPDVVLFDLPPIMESDDNYGFLKNVDCALIIVAAEKTSMSQIDVAERQVADLTNVLGLVLNKCRYPSKTQGHVYDQY